MPTHANARRTSCCNWWRWRRTPARRWCRHGSRSRRWHWNARCWRWTRKRRCSAGAKCSAASRRPVASWRSSPRTRARRTKRAWPNRHWCRRAAHWRPPWAWPARTRSRCRPRFRYRRWRTMTIANGRRGRRAIAPTRSWRAPDWSRRRPRTAWRAGRCAPPCHQPDWRACARPMAWRCWVPNCRSPCRCSTVARRGPRSPMRGSPRPPTRPKPFAA